MTINQHNLPKNVEIKFTLLYFYNKTPYIEAFLHKISLGALNVITKNFAFML